MNRMFMAVKIIILCFGFVLVVFLMTRLGSGKLPGGMSELFGFPSSGGGGERVATLMSGLNWCDTRVQELVLPGSLIVREVQMKWMAVSASDTRPMGTVQVEKWFSLHCKVNVEKVADAPAGVSFQPYMTVKFIKGEPVTLMRSADGLFQWKNEVFRSSELENAIGELAAQAQHATGG